jgi:hypothetical protein
MRQYEEPSFPADVWTRPRSRHYGANYGAGLKLIPHKNFLMRIDWRHYLTGKPYDLEFSDFQSTGGLLATMEATIGVSISF